MHGTLGEQGIFELEVTANTFEADESPVVALTADAGDLNARGNYWSTTDESEIASMIHDSNDDLSLGTVDFAEYLIQDDAATPAYDD